MNGDRLEQLEVGEATWSGGRVVSVYDSHRQALLQADVAIGATTLGPLDTVYPFNAAGGSVAVMLPEAAGPITYAYTGVDYDALTLKLVTGPAVLITAGAVVAPDPALVDRLADVREGTQVDPITCRVPYAMRPWLPVGTRAEGQGEEVLFGATTGAGYVLHDVLGAIPLLPEGGSWVGDMPVGTLMAWGAPTLPARWLVADGATYTVANYPELGQLLGARYGGDGITTFAVPNLTGRFARGTVTPGVPGASSDVSTHAHGSAGITTDSQTAHSHGSGPLNTDNPGGHDHSGGPLGTPSAGGHDHGSAGGHSHAAGSLNTQQGSPNTYGGSASFLVGDDSHTHNVGGSTASGGTHGHGSSGSHTHGVSGSTGTSGGHNHAVTGSTGDAGGHSHNVTGTGPAGSHVPPYLDLLWIIKATPGGDPLADGTYIEVRDEGIPDVPQATALDFRGAGVDIVQQGPVAVVTIGAQSGVTDHGALTGLADDDHLQYLTNARGDVRYAVVAHNHGTAYEPFGAVATHAAAADPHPGYLTTSEGNAAYEHLGAVATHAAQPDPHAGYATDSEVATAVSAHATSPSTPHPVALTNLSDVETAGAAQGDRLTYRGGVWHPEPAAGAAAGQVADFVRLTKGGSQGVNTGAGVVKITMTAAEDPAGYWDATLERMTLHEGVWQIHSAFGWPAAASRNGRMRHAIYLNGVERRVRFTPCDTVIQSTEVQEIIVVPEGLSYYVEFYAGQNSGANMNLENTGANGQTVTDAILIGPLPPALRLPDIVIEVAPAEGTAPVSVDGHATNIGGTITAFSWNMGDGSALLTGADVTYVYTVPGTYTVTCTATGPMGTDVATSTVSVS